MMFIQGWWKDCDMPGFERMAIERIRCPAEIKAYDIITMELNLEDEDNRWQHAENSCQVNFGCHQTIDMFLYYAKVGYVYFNVG